MSTPDPKLCAKISYMRGCKMNCYTTAAAQRLHRLPITQVTRYTGYTGYTGQSHQSKVKCDCQAMPLAPIHHSCRTTWLLQFEQAAVEVLEKHLTENEDEASAEPKQQGVQVRHRHCVDM